MKNNLGERYWLASDCPECGERDEVGAWKGARMSSTAWGHNYSCCSNTCGYAYLKNPKRLERDKAALRETIAHLQAALSTLESKQVGLADAK